MKLLNLAKKQGFLNYSDFERIWTSPITQKTNVRYFILNEIIEDDLSIVEWKHRKYKYIEEE